MENPNKDARLNELKKLDSWNQADVVEEQGWAIRPG